MPGYKPVAELRGKRPRWVTLSEASAMLEGLLSPGVIRDMILAGKVPGARKAGHRYFVDRRYVPDLVIDMSAGVVHDTPNGVQHMPPRPQPSTFDAPARWSAG